MFRSVIASNPSRCFTGAFVAVVLVVFMFASTAQAQFHGVAIAKVCTPLTRVCDVNADCSDANECTDDVCSTANPNTTSCQIRITNDDDFGDTLTIKAAYDTLTTAGGPVRIPAAGNLPIVAVSGNTNCVIGPFVECDIGEDLGGGPGRVTFLAEGYNPTLADLALPGAEILDQGTVTIADKCDSPTTSSCNTNNFDQNIGSASDLVNGCENPNLPDSTPCTDTDGNLCTTAGCDGAGVCDQLHIGPPTCGDDGNECTGPGSCDPATGECAYPNLPDSTPCTDTDGNLCTGAGCDGAGVCDQLHVPPPTCEGEPGGAECNVCDPSTGLCAERDPLPEICLPGEEICRTPGFWGSHGGTEKNRSQNITQAVIDAAGGLSVCGTTIDSTAVGSSTSALEAMCVSVKGDSNRQLVRQLTAAALNCVMSSGGAYDCSGTDLADLIADCNDVCAGTGTPTRTVNQCIDEIDCFNNGGFWDAGMCYYNWGFCDVSGDFCADGMECTGLGDTMCVPAETCHDMNLCPDFEDDGEINGSDFCFEPPGPAGSSGACNAARKNEVYVP